MLKPLNKTTLYEEVIKEILSMIKEGKWLPGDRIPGELALAESFQVSRNSVREALKFLELSGIIEAKAGKGTFLTMDSLKNLHRMELIQILKNDSTLIELTETRLTIEPQLAYFAAKRATKEDIKALEAALEKSKNAIRDNNYTTIMGWEFHEIIGAAAKNKILSNFINSITDELHAQRFMYIHNIVDDKALSNEIIDHEKMLEYIKNGEAEEVRDFIYNHINDRLNWIKEEIASQKG